ncbi:DEKNAAC105590 [Brettanomyces naardenensis]|uniref:DEKNAAC105590 n=1 Tax=Brettanomyces naardenensis TaxID=13370 RepID=A0A448YU24_BRENA|nr:DEKNAAC105590 [Brettanomyces naardenensis]
MPSDESDKNSYTESVRIFPDTMAESASEDSELRLSHLRSYDEVAYLEHEEETPLGRHIGVFGVVMMIVQRIIGSGIFAVSGSIYKDVGGSPFLFFLVWICAGYMSFAGIFCFLELGSIVPRSGGMKVFLEYVYYKPRMMMTVVFGIYSLLFGFVITNAIIFGEYTLYALGFDDVSSQAPKQIGMLFVLCTCVVNGVSAHLGVKIQNFVGVIKLVLLFLMALSGIWVLLFPVSITHIENNLHLSEFFTIKREVTVGSFSSALLKGIFSFGGWQTAQVVANEIQDPVKTMNIAAPLALSIINVCYFFINLSYLVVIPDGDLDKLQEMVGSILMEKLFGYTIGRQLLTLTVAISAAGNIMTVLYHISRMNQEIFREGFLPFSRFFASNHPFGSPMRCLIFPVAISSIFLLIHTPDNVYNYVIDLDGYPLQMFVGLTCFGIFVLRRRRPNLKPSFRANSIHVVFVSVFSLFMFIGPLNPFSKSTEFTGFPNYAYVALIVLFSCFLYWLVLFRILPTIGGYEMEQATITLSDGLTMKKWCKESEYENVDGV